MIYFMYSGEQEEQSNAVTIKKRNITQCVRKYRIVK